MIKFENVATKYVDESVVLALREYNIEKEKCKYLLDKNFEKELRGIIEKLFKNKYGKVAIENNKIIGYLVFLGPWDGFFGEVRGGFSPLGGSAFGGNDRNKLASQLFEEVSREMVKDKIFSFAISRYAHDDEVAKSLILNGFGIRCSDAILKLKDRKIVDSLNVDYTFKELKGNKKREIEEMKKKLSRHLLDAPTYFPTNVNRFNEWFDKEDIRVFIAENNKEIMGYMSLDTEAETFISDSKGIYNICGAYIDKRYRNKEVAKQLLEYICRVSENEKMTHLGVDCETLNPTALRFWSKYFDKYTYSYARRLDERIFGHEKYLR